MKEKMILIVLILLCMQLQNKAQELELPKTCYISTGDRDWKTGLPVDSKATIENIIEALATKFDVNRILWRGGQDDMWLKYYKPFEENRRLWQGYRQQIRWLRNEVGTSRIAIQAAHKRGMKVWLHTGLYAHGGPPDAGAEDLLRIKYPDCVPVNKYGSRRQDNLIEFCHSAAREALVKRYTGFLVENGYDGIIFYTYAEDLCLRYMDEYGYNQPIVEEYKRRYGKDILTEVFDKEAWARVRGDYVTLFLRELKESLAVHDKKLAVCIDPKHPYLPQTHGGPDNPHTTTGRIYLDWERWADQGIVDELAVAYTGSLEDKLSLVNEINDKVAGTGCRVSAWIENEPLKPGVTRIIHAYGPELESGLSYIDRKDLRTTSTLPASQILKEDDVIAKRRLLYLISQGKRTAGIKDIIPAANDDDVFVRQHALEALVAMKNPKAIPIIEAALRDPEHSVRCRAAVLLGEFYGSTSLEKIFDATALAEKSPHFILHCAVPSLCKMTDMYMDSVVLRITHNNVMVRRTAIYVLQKTGTSSL
ncbi:MAG: HEAT repeat domain-containing protein, partial [Bacteroidota bacterium]|nr:HEAT repeat domain-containing protein [Bacteroidota bacterium]